ncbi:hypothetical protein B4U80_00212, partial [Leptotrombidium deliense]
MELKNLKKQRRLKRNDEKSENIHITLSMNDEKRDLQWLKMKKKLKKLAAQIETYHKNCLVHISNVIKVRNQRLARYQNYEILNSRYLVLELVGKGGYGEVYKTFDIETQTFVACKVQKVESSWSTSRKKNYVKHIVRENMVHQKLEHDNIVKYLTLFEIDHDTICTVMEYCNGLNLNEYLNYEKTVTEREARQIIYQLICVLNYLNQLTPSIIHYDMKPSNIILKNTNLHELKVIDFGLCKIMSTETGCNAIDLTSQGVGTYDYQSPECLNRDASSQKIDLKVDIWSIGVIFYQ